MFGCIVKYVRMTLFQLAHPHSKLLLSFDNGLYENENYVCLVASNKQQINWDKFKEAT